MKKFLSFFTPKFIGFRYTVKTVSDNERSFNLHILDEQYKFLGITIFNESFGFEDDKDMWLYMINNNIKSDTLLTSLNRENLIHFREQQIKYFKNEYPN